MKSSGPTLSTQDRSCNLSGKGGRLLWSFFSITSTLFLLSFLCPNQFFLTFWRCFYEHIGQTFLSSLSDLYICACMRVCTYLWKVTEGLDYSNAATINELLKLSQANFRISFPFSNLWWFVGGNKYVFIERTLASWYIFLIYVCVWVYMCIV